MPDYSKSIIYTIRTRDGLYVGSTTNFTNRKHQHKSCILSTSLKNNLKLYQTIRDNDGEWNMKPYKEFPCENKTQLNIEEERIRNMLNADLNCNKCSGIDEEKMKATKKKWCDNNMDAERKRKKDLYNKNKKEILENHKEYYEKNKEKRKKYRKDNKQQFAAYQREYRKKQKEKMTETS